MHQTMCTILKLLILCGCCIIFVSTDEEVKDGYLEKVYSTGINSEDEFLISFIDLKTKIAYRLEVNSTDAISSEPVIVVVSQQNSVLAWQIPMKIVANDPKTDKDFIEYGNTSRTICQIDDSKSFGENETFKFAVAVTTQAEEYLNIALRVTPVPHYFIESDQTYDVVFSPSQPQYYVYEFDDNDDINTVRLQVSSDDDVCFTVSVQPYICPIYDLLDQIKYQGKYQTVSKSGGIVIHRNDFEKHGRSSFAIVFVAHGDNYQCDSDTAIPFDEEAPIIENRQISQVQFSVVKFKKSGDFSLAIWFLFGFNFLLSVVIFFFSYLFYRFGRHYRIPERANEQRDEGETASLNSASVDEIHESTNPKLIDFIRRREINRRKAMHYVWHIANVAIFYGLPVIQLMVFYLRSIHQTGDLDTCYYNNKCAHVYWHFLDFNHVYSNLGYGIFGILFLVVTGFRNCYIRSCSGRGIPKLYGLYYAMGVGLIFEGVLSASYHVCPNQANFQFDTSFMYVMAMLIMAKLYQNRHPDVQPTAYSTFTVLGLSVIIAMFGIIFTSRFVLIVFCLAYLVFCICIAFKVYFFTRVMHRLKNLRANHDLTQVKQVGQLLTPIRKKQMIFVVSALVINIFLAISGFFLYPTIVDFGSYLLLILMGNAIMHSFFYVLMKLTKGERICREAIFYGTIALILWVAGSKFFFNAATHWSKTPAQSREYNQGCILFDFYDTHDIWHILSAPALFFTFSFLSVLDDDLVEEPREQITVF